jgi:hypothetical protein
VDARDSPQAAADVGANAPGCYSGVASVDWSARVPNRWRYRRGMRPRAFDDDPFDPLRSYAA